MKTFLSGLVIGLLVAAFTWWLQYKKTEMYWTASATRFDPLVIGRSEYSGLGTYSLRVKNSGTETITNLNIEVVFPQSEILTANLQVPERSAIKRWTDVLPNEKRNSVNLEYGRLLANDDITIGALVRATEPPQPVVSVKSDAATAIPYDLLERRRKRISRIMEWALLGVGAAMPFLTLFLVRYRAFRNVAEVLSLPAAWILHLVGPHELRVTDRARQLMRKAKFHEATRVLGQSSDAYDQYLLARCHSALKNETDLKLALQNWLKGLYDQYVAQKRDFAFLLELPLAEELSKRLNQPF